MSAPACGIVPDVQLKSVLVATDFSAVSRKALHHALAIARHYGAKLYAMHVVSSLGLTIAGPDAIGQSTIAALREATLTERKLVASGALRGIHHQVIVRPGQIWAELQAVIREEAVDLLVIGTHGRTGLKRLVLGSVAEQIFRNARCPVLTVGPPSPPDGVFTPGETPRPILFATDFSAASLNALPYAASFANQRRSELVLAHMLSPVPPVKDGRWYNASDVAKMRLVAQKNAQKRLSDLVADAMLTVKPAFMVDFGEPAEGILRAMEAEHAELIVMGLMCRKHVETMSHLPWSTAYDIVCRAGCPVLTVRGGNPWE